MTGDWPQNAACVGLDTEAFYPSRDHDIEYTRLALAVCRACPVTAECLADELSCLESPFDMHGIRGGLMADERRELFTDREAAA